MLLGDPFYLLGILANQVFIPNTTTEILSLNIVIWIRDHGRLGCPEVLRDWASRKVCEIFC